MGALYKDGAEATTRVLFVLSRIIVLDLNLFNMAKCLLFPLGFPHSGDKFFHDSRILTSIQYYMLWSGSLCLFVAQGGVRRKV